MKDRERFELAVMTDRVFQEQHGRCFVCERIHYYPDAIELAHRIPKGRVTERWLANDFGLSLVAARRVIHHRRNLAGVCRGGSASLCNGKVSIRNHPGIEAALVREILEEIEKEKQNGQEAR